MELRGRTALVTGATGGLGHGDRPRAGGARRRRSSSPAAAPTCSSRSPPRPAAARSRATSPTAADVERLLDEAGDVDVLVANAGLPGSGHIDDFSVEDIDRALAVNLRAPMVMARRLAEPMAARGARAPRVRLLAVGQGRRAAAARSTRRRSSACAASRTGCARTCATAASASPSCSPASSATAGMFHDAGVKLPRVRRAPRRPRTSPRPSCAAIERDRAEIDVAPLGLRAGAAFAGLAPELSARLSAASAARRSPTTWRAASATSAPAALEPVRPGTAAAQAPRRLAASRLDLAGDLGEAGEDLVRELRAVAVLDRRGGHRARRPRRSRAPRARCGARRAPACWTASSSSDWTALGRTSGRSRARRSTAAGSRSGTTAALEHDVVGDHDRVLALREGRVEQAERADDALDLARRRRRPAAARGRRRGTAAPRSAPCRRSGCPSVCCAARPMTTAVIAPPTASVAGSSPPTRSDSSTASAIITSRIRNETVPAVAGSMRRNSAGRREAADVAGEQPAEGDHRHRGADADGRCRRRTAPRGGRTRDTVTAISGTITSSSSLRLLGLLGGLDGQAPRPRGGRDRRDVVL